MKRLAFLGVLMLPLVLAPLAALAIEGPLTLRPGYRAMSLPFPDHQMAFLDAGDHVDMMATFEAVTGKKGSQSKEPVTATLLQNVRVLAVERTRGVVLLEVNPNEAQYAALFAEKDKTLWLTKRNIGDEEMKPMEMAVARKLFR